MRILARSTGLAILLAWQLACTQAGDVVRPAPLPGASPLSEREPVMAPPAPVAPGKPTEVKPAVPPVPDSPIKANCAKLPTQVERDTCTNTKEATG